MGKRRENATDKLGRSLLGGAMASGLAAASLYGVGPANATCVGISGIDIGDGCESTFGNFSIGLGPDTQAHSNGLLTGAIAIGDGTIADVTGILTAAWAGGTGSAAAANGFIAWAVAQGDGDVVALAGDAPVDIANFAFNVGNATDGAVSFVEASDGAANLAANLGGNANAGGGTGPVDMDIFAGEGSLNSAINVIGNRNIISAGGGFLNNATSLGSIFDDPNAEGANGSDNDVISGFDGNLNVAFTVQPPLITEACDVGPCGNIVDAGPGSFGVAGAIGLVNRIVDQDGPGITINTPLNPPPSSTNVLAAGGRQAGLVRNSLNFSPGGGNSASNASSRGGSSSDLPQATSRGGSVLKSVSARMTTSVKKLSDAVSNATRGLAGDAKPDTGATSGEE